MAELPVIPESGFNLFSGTRMMDNGWIMSGDKEKIVIKKGGQEIVFDIKIRTPKGVVFCAYIKPRVAKGTSNVAVDQPPKEAELKAKYSTKSGSKIAVKHAHSLLGHCGEAYTRSTAKALNWTLTQGGLGNCEDCAVSKARQKNLPREVVLEDDLVGQQVPDEGNVVHMDISSIKNVKGKRHVSKPHWNMLVFAKTRLKASRFYKAKNDIVEPTCEMLDAWKKQGHAIDTIRCDNAGENKSVEKRAASADWKLGLNFEYTARDTPQQNSLAEVGLYTVQRRGIAMMSDANIGEEDKRRLLCGKVWSCATKLDGLIPITIDGVTKTKFEHQFGKNPAFADHLRVWGEAGVVKLHDDMDPKTKDRGVTCMFVDYPTGHSGDTYEMWDPVTGGVHVTRDIIWLGRMFFERNGKVKPVLTDMSGTEAGKDEDGGAPEMEPGPEAEQQPVQQPVQQPQQQAVQQQQQQVAPPEAPATTTRSGRTVKPVTRLIEEAEAQMAAVNAPNVNLNIEKNLFGMTEAEADYYDAMQRIANKVEMEIGLVGAGLGGGFDNTAELHVMKYDEAMAKEPEAWTKSVDEEHDRFVQHKVVKPVPIEEVPEGASIMSTTWAMKLKANGDHRARINARGFEQKEGEHYDKDNISAPVVNNATVCIVMVLIVMMNWFATLVDIQGAFLTAEFEGKHKNYIKVPQGFEKFYPGNVVLLLLKTLYGTKNAARAFWMKLIGANLSKCE